MAYPTTLNYKNAIRQSGGRKTVVDLYYNRQTTPVMTDLPVIGGSINVDGSAAVRRSGSITLASSELISPNPPFTLEPLGMELGIRMGVTYPDGTEELVPVGKFLITDLDYSEDDEHTPTLTFQDRSQIVNDTSNKTGSLSFAGQSAIAAIKELLRNSPFSNQLNTSFNEPVDALTLSAKQLNLVVDSKIKDIKVPGGDPFAAPFWDDIQGLAESLGAEIYFYVDGGNVILRKIPTLTSATPESAAVFTVDAGPNGILINANRGLSRNDSYNGVVITGPLPADGKTTTNPPSVFVYDQNPNSRTYFWGPYGKKVYQMTSDTVTDKGQLEMIARAQLGKLLGLTQSCTFNMLMDPSMEPGDIVKLVYRDGTTELQLVVSFSLDLAWGGSMTVSTQSKQII